MKSRRLGEGLPFSSRSGKDARTEFRQYAEPIPLGSEVDGRIMEVLRRHPEYEVKCPSGAIIKKMKSPFGGWRLEVWQDGKFKEDFSWVTALKGKLCSLHVRASQAARRAVDDQILEFKICTRDSRRPYGGRVRESVQTVP